MSSLKMVGEGGEFVRGFFTPFPLVRGMRRVLHVGPCDTPGGMATVMHTLAEFPPEGWEAELLASHAPGGCGRNGGPIGGLDVNSNDDAATQRFVPMWFMFTLRLTGLGGGRLA